MASTVKLKTVAQFARYSPSEQEVFRLIPKGKRNRIDTGELTELFYKGKTAPLNRQNVVNGFLRMLEKKVKHNKEEFKICRTKRNGPHSTEVWIEPQ